MSIYDMTITINYMTIHKLNKEKSKPIKSSNIREELFPIGDPSVIKLITNVSNLYGKRNNSAQYGVFIEGEGRGIFPDEFIEYQQNSQHNNDDFHKLSVQTMTSLYENSKNVPFATGGYILFADYQTEQNTRLLLVAMIKQKNGVRISGDLNLEELQYIDEDKLYVSEQLNPHTN